MLRLRHASRWFGRHPVFTGLDLDVPTGTRLLVTGGNGSGKTTLLRCLSGALSLTSGQATVGGHPAGSLAARRLLAACLSPEQGLYNRLSGRDNLLLAARRRWAPRGRPACPVGARARRPALSARRVARARPGRPVRTGPDRGRRRVPSPGRTAPG
ncbi:ATP-binding cassette domain-containing protein [Micromonospora sp. NPDC048830]|uniref:ABC transporter ATP-binding protein n=1 Tax=Micromonospora sp. NPDC048830 TaxID=3364257 RepID=UPI003710EA15